MPSILWLCCILLTGILAAPVPCWSNTAHVTLGCGTCHTDTCTDYNDPYLCNECLSCHNEASTRTAKALEVQTHSSAAIGSDKHGEWGQRCLSCHDPHWHNKIVSLPNQEGTTDDSFKIADFTVNWAVRNTTDSTVTFVLEDVVIHDPEWTDPATWLSKSGDGRGLILLLNYQAGQGWVLYEVDDILHTTDPRRTKIVLGSNWRAFPTGENPISAYLIYGMLIRDNIRFWNGSAYETIATEMTFTGPHSMAYDESESGTDPTPTGICQVCHENTTHWKSDGSFANHFSGWNCITCHPHELGFKASPSPLCFIDNGDPSMMWDCNSAWGGENPLCAEDCAEIPGGDAVLDDCGVCNGDSTTCTGVVRGGTVTLEGEAIMWQQATADIGTLSYTLPYYDAEAYCSALSFAGYTNWRLPTKEELKGLVRCENADGETITETPLVGDASCELTLLEDGSWIREYERPTIDIPPFVCNPAVYWAQREERTYWSVNFITGRTWFASYLMNYYVRCVRDIE